MVCVVKIFSNDSSNNAVIDLANKIAMHITALKPLALDENSLDAAYIEKEREIYMDQAKNSGKPEEIAAKIVDGKMDKFCKDNALLEQSFVKDPNMTVGEVITDIIAKLGGNISISRFSRFQLGESSDQPSGKESE